MDLKVVGSRSRNRLSLPLSAGEVEMDEKLDVVDNCHHDDGDEHPLHLDPHDPSSPRTPRPEPRQVPGKLVQSLPFVGALMTQEQLANPGPSVMQKDREMFTSTGRVVRMPTPDEMRSGIVRFHSTGYFIPTRRQKKAGPPPPLARARSSITTSQFALSAAEARELRHFTAKDDQAVGNGFEHKRLPEEPPVTPPTAAGDEKKMPELDKKEVVVHIPESGHSNQDNPQDEKWMQTSPHKGLNDADVEERRLVFGFNELVEKKRNPLLKFLSYFTGSIAYLIEAACLLSGILQDWTDFGIILALLFVNACIGFIEEARAESAIESLRSSLALHTMVVRNSQFTDVPARELLPGDIISLRLGDIVPADCKLLGLNGNFEETKLELSIDQSALTGESLPVNHGKGSTVWSGTIVKQGQQLAIVSQTGEKTFLGRAAHLISITEESGHFQKVITQIGNFIILITLVLVVIILVVAVAKGQSFVNQLNYALVLTIASIPVGLPTVLSVTMAVGAKQLAAKHVIVKRLTAVEEMAGLNILCSDKTGTLTLNQLTLDEPYLAFDNTNADLLLVSYLASEAGAKDAIELCVRAAAVKHVPLLQGVDPNSAVIPQHKQVVFHPFDPVSKLTKAVVRNNETGEHFCVAKGAPQVIIKLCHHEDIEAQQAILQMAKRGLRALAVAKSLPMEGPEENNVQWKLVGMLSLLDPPRHDSGTTITECKKMGLSVKMITGDSVLIAKEVAKRLGMYQNILNSQKLSASKESEEAIAHYCERADGFAQVVPEDKFRVVELLQKAGYLVGMTGDGVNDAPALKRANVGIAVHGCTDAARSAADIVLLKEGLSTIVDGIITSRQIFQRMRSYAVYRITSTVHFMIFMFFAILILNWSLPPAHIVLIALLNDAATIVISVDNALVSERPDKWRLGQLMTLSVVLGLMLTASSFAHWFLANNYFNVTADELNTIMYLQMSSCPHFVIFATRLPVMFWRNPPSPVFFIAIVGTQIFAMFISVYGVIVSPVGWPWAASVMSVSVGWFMVIDLVKVYVYSIWSFELTARAWPSKARREKLHDRHRRKEFMHRYEQNVGKVRKVVKMIEVVKKWGNGEHYHNLPEQMLVMPPSHH